MDIYIYMTAEKERKVSVYLFCGIRKAKNHLGELGTVEI